MDRGPIVEIDLEAIAHNFRIAKKITGNRPIIAVVKADAYGHGSIEASRRLVKEGASYLAVAYAAEAVALRQADIKTPLIVLFDKYDINDYFKYNLVPVIHDIKTAQVFSKEAKKRKQGISVHIKADTGMGRLGFNIDDLEKNINAIIKMDFLTVTGLMSHFSDADLSDRSYALMQLDRFNKLKNTMIKKGLKPLLSHIANSAAVMSLPESHLDAIRPGLMLYGYSPLAAEQGPRGHSSFAVRPSQRCGEWMLRRTEGARGPSIKIRQTLESLLRPAMTVKTKILSLRKLRKGSPVSYGRTFITSRDSLIAVLPVGYADGYSRVFSNNSDVLVRGKRSPVVGRVCMDTTMVDVTDVRGVIEGEDVVLIGRQKADVITASELAMKAGTIPYEILTSFGNKSRKVYTDGS
ncbi:MAG: alanine racemase [Thermodesulfovibrionales bacterium]|nr:alanine racemase [Thermodesulfovibrionales bacterium]